MSHAPQRTQGFTIKTPQALAAIAKNFAPVIIQDGTAPTPPSSIDYFARMNVTSNVELDAGSDATYDVQLDTRFIANYIQMHIASAYPEYNLKGHPMVSSLTLAGYCMLLVYAHLLANDFYTRPTKSYFARTFHSDATKKDYLDILLEAHVPPFLATILEQIAPVYDPRRTNHLFVPTLAAYSHRHDFGRTLPPSMWLYAHHELATSNPKTDPDEYSDNVAELTLVTYEEQPFMIANYIGTRAGFIHPNWVNLDFEGFFNPLVGRTLIQKPTFSKLPLYPPTYEDFTRFDPYEYLLCADEMNINTMMPFIGSLSTFVKSHYPGSHKLGTILGTLSGPLLFNHSIEPPTLPTWTGITATENAGDSLNDAAYADKHKFLVAPQPHKGKIEFPIDLKDLILPLYRLIKSKFNPTDSNVKWTIFKNSVHINPYVLYFQPYDVSPSSLAFTIICGIKIELAEIDGFTIPTAHPESSLDDNNSQYLQSAVRISQIHTILDKANPTTAPLCVISRRFLDRTSQAIAFAFRDMSKNVLPSYPNENVADASIAITEHPGFTYENHHDSPHHAYTYTAGTQGTLPLGDTKKIYAWSSYRIVHSYGKPKLDNISMILSFNTIHGSNITLSRSKNPSLLIPH
jgi:hypothetical protein